MRNLKLTAPQIAHAGQIGSLLQSTVASAGNSSDEDRHKAADWWKLHLDAIIAEYLKQSER